MLKTKNNLSEEIRQQVCEILNQNMADAFDLYSQAKQAHWNVKGLQFRALHELFDEVSETARKFVDEFAERSVQLGGIPAGTIRTVARDSRLQDYPVDLIAATAHVDTLGDRVATVAKFCREAIDRCAELGDQATADMFTDATIEFDKLTWMIEALLGDQESVQDSPVRKSQMRSSSNRLGH